MTTQFTKIPYQYVDASNYKAGGIIFVSGVFSLDQRQSIQENLDGGEFFIAPQVGLRALQRDLSSFPSEDDHVWSKLDTEDFEVVDAIPENCSVLCDAAELAARFEAVTWDVAGEHARLGLNEID